MDKQTLSTFCVLLARSLWNPDKPFVEGEIPIINDEGWRAVANFASEHRVAALVADALPLLPEERRLTEEITNIWNAVVYAEEAANATVDETLCALFTALTARGIRTFVGGDAILSSLCLSRWRRMGIDLFIGISHRVATSLYIKGEGGTIMQGDEISYETFSLRGVECKMHFRAAEFHRPTTRRYFHNLEMQAMTTKRACTITIGDTRMSTFSPIFQILCLTADIQRRLISGRAGWREVCGWAMLLHGERTALGIAETRLVEHLDHLRLSRLYNALGHVARQYLHLPCSHYAALRADKKDAQRGAFLLLCINERCVYGCSPCRPYDPDESTRDAAVRLCRLFHRCWRLRHLCPSESFFTPWAMLGRAVKSFFFG